jgi:hypothetical protein
LFLGRGNNGGVQLLHNASSRAGTDLGADVLMSRNVAGEAGYADGAAGTGAAAEERLNHADELLPPALLLLDLLLQLQ